MATVALSDNVVLPLSVGPRTWPAWDHFHHTPETTCRHCNRYVPEQSDIADQILHIQYMITVRLSSHNHQ